MSGSVISVLRSKPSTIVPCILVTGSIRLMVILVTSIMTTVKSSNMSKPVLFASNSELKKSKPSATWNWL